VDEQPTQIKVLAESLDFTEIKEIGENESVGTQDNLDRRE
jgi:hypothetical protein